MRAVDLQLHSVSKATPPHTAQWLPEAVSMEQVRHSLLLGGTGPRRFVLLSKLLLQKGVLPQLRLLSLL